MYLEITLRMGVRVCEYLEGHGVDLLVVLDALEHLLTFAGLPYLLFQVVRCAGQLVARNLCPTLSQGSSPYTPYKYTVPSQEVSISFRMCT